MINLLINLGKNVDAKLSHWYLLFIIVFCTFSMVNFIRVDYVLARNWNGWAIGDWLLNYENGFIRRGLIGELIIGINQYLNAPINLLIFGTQCIVFLLFLITYVLLLRNKAICFWYLVACLEPGFLLFNYYDGMSVGRKEILLYLIFGIWCLVLQRNKPSNLTVTIFSISIFTLTLSHEMVIFFIPYFIMAYALLYSDGARFYKNNTIFIAMSSFFAVSLLILFGNQISEKLMCDTFLKLGAQENICKGIISYGMDNSLQTLRLHMSQTGIENILLSIMLAPVAVFPFYLALKSVQPIASQAKGISIIIIFLSIFTLPLFLLSIDWGRWIAIHITLCIMLLAQHLPLKSVSCRVRHGKSVNFIIYDGAYKSNIIVASVIVGALLIFNLSYSLNHCCTANLVKPLGPIKKLITTIRAKAL